MTLLKYLYKKIIIVFVSLLILNGCTGIDDDEYRYGFRFRVFNHTNQEYDAEVVIGAFKNGIFIPTDSIQMNPIVINKPKYDASSFFKEKNRWKPDMRKIRAIPSDSVFFKLKLTKDRHEFIKKSETDNALYGLKIPKNNRFEYSAGGVGFRITNTSIYDY